MRSAMVIARREFSAYWVSPLGWILLGLFSLISGWLFFNVLVTYVDNIQALPSAQAGRISFLQEVVVRLFANINFILIFFVPLVSMRLFAEEKRMGTMQLLYSAPVTDKEILLGKWLGSLGFLLSLLAVTLVYPVVLFSAGLDEWRFLIFCYCGLVLNCTVYLGMGMWASTLTDNPMVAALLSFVLLMMLAMFNWVALTTHNFYVSELVNYLGISLHFENLLRGVVDTSDICWYVTAILFFPYLAAKALAARNW